ncbi:NIL domain-containing protein [Chamaesiphon sp. VAR_48_metabat_403]|uniref:NIL domain-containing protein n=1 Tax=Chamaesiphon sp. VAR_48_metabat_403 TaxID=2964700 RepID=UPI00286E3EC9|nr:NIL domain-containing protein [Chamaesiphon sp. VAR_48_metabat_403]
MSLPSNADRKSGLYSIDIHIPAQLHQQPVLATLIANYNLIINIRAAVLDRKATGGGWFNLSLEGEDCDIDNALDYLRNLGIEIFAHSSGSLVGDLDLAPAKAEATQL